MNIAQHTLLLAVRLYRWVLSPAKQFALGPAAHCRFTPTCSEYALEAVQRHGAARGTLLAAGRLCRCHPWGGCGFDPVPMRGEIQRPKFKVQTSPSPRGRLAMGTGQH